MQPAIPAFRPSAPVARPRPRPALPMRLARARSQENEDVTTVRPAISREVRRLEAGSFARTERMVKWNEAPRIEEAPGPGARSAGGG